MAERPGTADDRLLAEAAALMKGGDYDSAETRCRRLLERHPDQPGLRDMLGVILMNRGRHGEAVDHLQRAVAAGRPYAGTYNNLALALNGAGRPDEAIEAAHAAVRLGPEVAEFHVNLGNRLRQVGRIPEAITAYRQAACLDPGLAAAYVGLGNAHAAVGEGEAAVVQYRRALAVRPDHAGAFYHLVLSMKGRGEGADRATVETFRRLAESGRLPPSRAVLVHNALGLVADRQGDHDTAFRHMKTFNDTARRERAARGHGYDRHRHGELVDRIIAAFPPDAVPAGGAAGAPSRRPFFIVGMPRSGTTLVEQVLAGHPAVAPGGELPDLDRIAARLPGYPEAVRGMSGRELAAPAARYLARLERIDPEAPRVTDKMPRNFLHLGLVARLFPGATVVHCRRDPLDTCLSCYFQNFADDEGFSNDLEDLAAYYLDYARLMAHWRRVLPISLVEIDYEALVSHPEPAIRRLVGEVGLAWDAGCLDHAASRRPVLTASQWQVRQPITAASVGRWRHYRDQLAPLITRLDREADEGPGRIAGTPGV